LVAQSDGSLVLTPVAAIGICSPNAVVGSTNTGTNCLPFSLDTVATTAPTNQPCLRAGDALNRELIARAEAIDSPRRVVLDMDSTEVPVYGQQERSAYNGHFECTCYHPLLFNREGDCLAAKLRPANVHSAEGWEELLLPEIERQQRQGK
jgi:hypothetical protein